MKKILATITAICLIVVLLPINSAFALETRPSYLFAIDAGHGGGDSGCIGTDGRYEANDTLKIANEVISLLNKQGQRTYFINRSLGSDLRPVEANNINADFLISLHRDSSKSSLTSGINIYTHHPEHIEQATYPSRSYAPAERADKHVYDERLVNNLYNYFSGATGLPVFLPHYGSASSPTFEDYRINRISNMPSCIIELGFATNANDNAIFDNSYKTLAVCIVKALMATVGLDYVGPFANSSVGAIYTQNGKNYYVINGEINWNFSGEIEYANNIYKVTNGMADTPLAPVGGKAGFTGNAKWLYNKNVLTVFDGSEMGDYSNNNVHPWGDEFSSLEIKNGVKTIGSNAFSDCSKIETVVLTNSVEQIKNGAFKNCTGLKTVSFFGKKEEFNNILIGKDNECLKNANILYICDLEEHKYNFKCSSKCSVCGEKRITTHTYSYVCDEICDICREKRVTTHTYSSECDRICNVCMHRRDTLVEHDFDDNDICKNCGTKKYIIGDVDGDEEVTDSDAVYLLMHTFFEEDYPVYQPCDFNEDGSITDADAVYLLMYTFFPEDYPI